MTILFNEIVFGPIHSRRLGISLGVNLLPLFGKLCNFDCLYCECGFNKDGRQDSKIPTAQEVITELEQKLKGHDLTMGEIDTITFSGNGEPTMHPNFEEIIEATLALRNMYAKEAKVSVLTNGSRIAVEQVARALMSVDNAIIKIDSAFEETINLIDRPQYPYSLEKMALALEPFRGKFVLQTMFLRGEFEGKIIDNTTKEEVEAWYQLVERIDPREIMIYTLDRETPLKSLSKVSVEEMERIAAPLRSLGKKISISG